MARRKAAKRKPARKKTKKAATYCIAAGHAQRVVGGRDGTYVRVPGRVCGPIIHSFNHADRVWAVIRADDGERYTAPSTMLEA